MKKADIHIVHKGGKWAVETEHQAAEAVTFENRDAAVSAGKKLAKEKQVELIIHELDGTIGERDSYGHDPRNVPG